MAEIKSADEFVSTREAAQMLGVALRTVQLWVEAGVLTAWKTAGGHRRVVRASVEALLQQKAAALAAVPAASKGMRTAPASFRLLVIEDEPALLKMYSMYVNNWKLPNELLTASDGFEGLLRIGEKRPDLVIADLRMPGMDGFQMLRSLRATADFRDLQVIVVTALSQQDIASQGGIPADIPVFTKPVPFAEIERQVRSRVEARKPRRASTRAARHA